MKYLVNIIGIALIVLLVFAAISFKDTDAYYSFQSFLLKPVDFVKKWIEVIKHNMFFESTSERREPVTTVKKEVLLAQMAPDFFGNFDRDDWQKFWGMIYRPVRGREGKFSVKRYRTEEEIQSILMDTNPEVFSRFDASAWQQFWRIIFEE
ncbi:MAG: hypothetical protein GF375_01430 [Candidatus Omnitrophica bacterium]|nr:hypothetical protein [Candidatus Omnitrophota bacterium]MBD3268792.1 hypothetical protein [Candidatus Omnitrophota bacterium]